MNHIVILSVLATMVAGIPKYNNYKRTPLGDSVDMASMKMLKEFFQSAKNKNIIASPLGALTLLSMYTAGTEGLIKEEILQLLSFTDYDQLQESYGNLSHKFSSMDPSYLVLANKVYVSNKYILNDQFSNVTRRAYKSEVEQVNFHQKKATVDTINKWADEITKGHIKSPVDEHTIDKDLAVALFNVVFFQARWFIPFNANETVEKDFYLDESKTVKKAMMKLLSSLLYHQMPEIAAKMVGLFYNEDGFRMIIVLPDKKDGLAEVIEKLAEKGILDHVFALKYAKRRIIFEMPKFNIKSSLNLNDVLSKVGVSSIFSEGAYGVVHDCPVKVSQAFQEAFIKVNEEGSVAGAITVNVLI